VIGSANLDPRSLRLNFEFNIEIFDSDLGITLARHFEAVRNQSKEITLAEIDARSFWVKLRDSSAKLFAPYL
jgi:cardiolipin synthase